MKVFVVRGDNSSAADLAEIYGTMDSSIEPGDVVALDTTMHAGVKKSSGPYDPLAIGVISTRPNLVMGGNEDPGSTSVIVALAGRVPIKVSKENGPIAAGDLLTASSTPGVAMKATKAGQIIGQAMSWFDDRFPDEIGLVGGFLKPSFSIGTGMTDFMPGLTLTDPTENSDANGDPGGGLDTSSAQGDPSKMALLYFIDEQRGATPEDSANRLSEILSDRIMAGVELITPRVVTQSLVVDTIEPATGSNISMLLQEDGKFVIQGPVVNASDGSDGSSASEESTNTDSPMQDVITFDGAGNAMFMGDVTARSVTADRIVGLEVFTDRVAALSEGLDALSEQAAATEESTTTFADAETVNLALLALQSSLDDWQEASTIRMDQLTGVVDNLSTLAAQFQLANEGFTTTDTTLLGRVDGQDVLIAGLSEQLTAIAETPMVDVQHLDGVETLRVSGAATLAGGLHVDQITAIGDLLMIQSDVAFIGRPYFDNDTGGFAVIAAGTQGIRVVFDHPYLEQPVVNATPSFETSEATEGVTKEQAQAELDRQIQTLFQQDIRFLIVDKDETGFTLLLNKTTPYDLKFSWMALAIRDARTFLRDTHTAPLVGDTEPVTTEPVPTPSGPDTNESGVEPASSPTGEAAPVDDSSIIPAETEVSQDSQVSLPDPVPSEPVPMESVPTEPSPAGSEASAPPVDVPAAEIQQ